jgi:hypothetical protein
MTRTKPHPIGNRLLVPAIEQTERDQQQRKTQTQGEGRQQSTSRIAPQIAPANFHQPENACHC